MILLEWKSFGTDTNMYTQDNFEQEVGDTFEAMMFDNDQSYPSYIWTPHSLS